MKARKLDKLAITFAVGFFLALCANGAILLHVMTLHRQALTAQDARRIRLQLAAEIERETAALSRMVRAYTTSGDTRFLNYYYDIIDIRQGKRAAPDDYGPTYWAEVMAGSRDHVMPDVAAGVSTAERMRQQGFGVEEFDILDRIVAASNRLFEQDQIAFAATQGLYDPVAGAFSDEGRPDRQFASGFVHSSQYLRLESALLHEVAAFSRYTDRATQREVRWVSARLTSSIYAAVAILAVTLVLILLAMGVIFDKVLAPLRSLTTKALELGGGNYGVRADTEQGVQELQTLGRTFNAMAEGIEKDIGHREQILSQLRQATAIAEESTLAKTMFLANVSHEIRTPMNAIVGLTYLTLNTDLAPKQRDYLEKIRHASQALLHLINSILDFTQIEAGRLELQRTPFSLETLVGEILSPLRRRAGEKGVILLLEMEDRRLLGDRPRFLGDPHRLRQVLESLLDNALKFTDRGWIKLRLEGGSEDGGGSSLRATIVDTGIGMAPEQLDRLFLDFSQADGSSTRRHGGTGLGLTLAKRLLQLMGGTIEVTSSLGVGTSFVCELPLLPLQEGRDQADVLPRGQYQALVIDGDEAVGRSLVFLLAALGVRAMLAADATEGQKMVLEEGPFHLLLADRCTWDSAPAGWLEGFRRRAVGLPFLAVEVTSSLVEVGQNHAGIDLRLAKPVLPGEVRGLLVRLETAPPTAIELTPATLSSMRVLLVEDSVVNQEIAAEMLAYYGVAVEVAGNGRIALDFLEAKPDDYYHLVLLDIEMPILNGYETIAAIRGRERFRRLPVVAMTAHALEEDQRRCRQLGMNGHISKPFRLQELMQILSPYAPQGESAKRETSSDFEAESGHMALPLLLPGVDQVVGLALCAGRPDLYLRILQGYLREYGGLVAKLQCALAEERWGDLATLAHGFKGLSGTIGAAGLSSLAAEIEAEARHRSPQVVSLIEALEPQLEEVVSVLEEHFSHLEPAASSHTATGDGAERDMIAELRNLLRESDSAVLDLWQQGQAAWSRMLTADKAAKIGRAIHQFRFDEALFILDQGLSQEREERR